MGTLDDAIRDLAERMVNLVHEAYRRGEADALERVVQAARSGQMQVTEAPDTLSGRGEITSHEERKRAPKGTVGVLVDRALNNGSGKTPDEIKASATGDHEQMVAVASIRSHLRAGADQGRYRKQGYRWFAISRVENPATDPAPAQPIPTDMWRSPREGGPMP
jgi:hypothetical protein